MNSTSCYYIKPNISKKLKIVFSIHIPIILSIRLYLSYIDYTV